MKISLFLWILILILSLLIGFSIETINFATGALLLIALILLLRKDSDDQS